MKKVFNFFKSMKFGIILLVLISIISVAGSLIPQEYDAMFYVRNYSWYGILLRFQLDHVFTSWYFILLVILLCLNLSLCSIIRFNQIRKTDLIEAAKQATTDVKVANKQLEVVEKTLAKEHLSKQEFGDIKVYSKNNFGKYGTFITHLGILLTVIFFALAMYTPQVIDQVIMPGEYLEMADGTTIAVNDFHIEDEEGNLDYRSQIIVTLPDGRSSGIQEAYVNYPVKFGNYKIYQQTYGTIGQIRITDTAGNEDVMYLEDGVFLSKDGRTGIWFNRLYPDFSQENGEFSLTTSVSGRYPNPVYTFNLVELNDEEGSSDDLKMTSMLAFPHDEIEVGDLTFHFEDPVEYPGLRIKMSYQWIEWMLMLAFLIMTLGFTITFLFQQVVVAVTKDGYRILGPHQEGISIALKQALGQKKG